MNVQHLSRDIVSPEAAEFLISLHEKFDNLRRNLLIKRRTKRPGFMENTLHIRESEWTVAEAPPDLRDRRVEITGPAEPKMMINAMNYRHTRGSPQGFAPGGKELSDSRVSNLRIPL